MDAQTRREKLLAILREKQKPVSGGVLAELLGVSRQVIVQDIALLRAGGEDVFATPQGYILAASLRARPRKVFAVQHEPNESAMEEELSTIIKEGGRVLDVIVEHPLYGELKGLLMLATLADLREFLAKYRESKSKAKPLSALTQGVHLHTVEADNEGILAGIADKLKKRGFLLKEV